MQNPDYNVNIQTREWTLAGQVNNFYSKIINWETDKPWYATRSRGKHFFLKKRKWYKKVKFFQDGDLYAKYNDWNVTDIQEVNDSTCKTENCKRYFMLENQSKTRFVIVAERCSCTWASDFCLLVPQGREREFCKCECWHNKFTRTDFARWTVRYINTQLQETGIQANEYIETLATTGKIILNTKLTNFWTTAWINVWDYLFVNYSSNSSNSGYCWQTRRVIDYKQNTDTGKYEIILDAPWLWLSATQPEWEVWFRVFSDWGETLVFSACDGLYVLNTKTDTFWWWICDDDITKICDIWLPASWINNCILSVADVSGKIHVLNSTGYNSYGRNWLDKFYFSTDQQNYVGKDKFLTVSYRNHLLSFGKNSIYTTVATSDTDNFTYELSENIGIWSRNARGEFDNTFMFLWTNKRLYTLSVEKDWNGYSLNLQDISEPIRGMLKQIKDNDEVSIYSDSNELKVFIASRKSEWELNPTKTRIIIYDKQYKFWHEHHICQYGIQGQNKNTYFGDWYYLYCWFKDWEWWLGADGTINIKSELTAYIGEHESLDVLPFKLYTRKRLDTLKIILGKGTYTDNTYLTVKEDRNGFRYSRTYKWLQNIERVKNMNSFFENGSLCDQDILMPDCYTQDECENLNDKNKDYTNCRRQTKRQTCHCIDEFYEQEDFCNTLKDPTAHIAEVYPVKYKIDGWPSDVIEVTFTSDWFDRPSIGWIIGIVKLSELEDGDDDGDDVIGYTCCEGKGLTC